ncbi:MAG: restriction endonuclease subunit S [Oscillospiraceae bacterium]|jgi:type I restriction enzyme S subunit|nr:restriction endonuclease subunit S [Oscillospiraceae bacterium]
MAKTKTKNKTLTEEERLTEALVPESDQPYTVPDNWVWTRLGIVAKWGSGGTPSRKNSDYYGGDIFWIKTGELNNTFIHNTEEKITELALEESSAKIFPKNTIVIAMYGATIGKVAIMAVPAATNQACACGVPSDALYFKFFFYYALSQKDSFIKKGKGGAQPNISQEIIKAHNIPLPPLPEQHRIIERIESLFQKLNRAKELVQSALDSFETRKATILHKAFTGELTAGWREENGVGMDSWENKPLKKVAKMRSGYAFDSKKFIGEGYQVIRMGNLYNGLLDTSRAPVFMSKESLDEVILEKFLVKKDDILLTLTGTKYKRDYGYAVLINFNEKLLVNQRILSLTPENVEPLFLLHYLRSDIFRDVFFSKETGGVNQGNVSSTFVCNIEICLPTKQEQQEIVRILDSLFEKEQRARELCNIIDKIELMKKTILARAFRGELGTNDPSEESSIKSLMRINRENE